jgi:type III restriction enzyme
VRYTLKDYQADATHETSKALRRATVGFSSDADDYWSVVLSAPTGAGKTVIATAVIESLFVGNEGFSADPLARVLWVTDDPALNVQTQRNMLHASSALSPGRLIKIDSSFDDELFEAHHLYFLNIQKLARSNPLSTSVGDRRSYSIWETLANTIQAYGPHLYVVIDEAHRGMRQDSDRPTIVSRIINGQPGINPPAPIVWGISATPERFTRAITRWEIQRTTKIIDIAIEDVRSSGLLKDRIILDSPAAGQAQSDTTLVRAAVRQTRQFEADWHAYAEKQSEPPVVPVLVVQVANTPTEAELTEVLAAILEGWDGLQDRNIVNTFGEHMSLSIAGHTISYMAPHDIQDDLDVRVVLFKDAISTGWDCPRAEVLVSMRRAEDYTYIAQLMGRMVRTPLARRIATDQTLNDVHCYLPHFNKSQVSAIAKRFGEGAGDEPPVDVITDPIRLWRNEAVPAGVFDLLSGLPTYVVPGRIYRSQVSRLHTLATLLSGDHVVEDAQAQVRIQLNGVLAAHRERLELDGTFQGALEKVRNLKVERSIVLVAVESLGDLPASVSYQMARDDNNVDDLFRVAMRKFPEGLAQRYWDSIVSADEEDPTEAKAVTATLALFPEVVEAVHSTAEALVRQWLRAHQREISQLLDARKASYEPVKRETRNPELADLILPDTKVVSEVDQVWTKHVLANEEGIYPCAVKGWEPKVLAAEMRDRDLVAWYRNPTGGNGAVRIPYQVGPSYRPMYPDFIFFHQTDSGVRPSLIDPHGYHFSDAADKLKGFATYAENHAGVYARMESIVEIDGRLIALDLKSAAMRDAVRPVVSGGLKDLYLSHGGDYV